MRIDERIKEVPADWRHIAKDKLEILKENYSIEQEKNLGDLLWKMYSKGQDVSPFLDKFLSIKQNYKKKQEKYLAQIVGQEIKEYQKKFGEDWHMKFFNNFSLNLPDDDCENGGFYRGAIKEIGRWDKKPEEYYKQKDLEGHSKLYKNQTKREFFETIDRAIIEQGISIDEIKRLQRLKNENPGYLKSLYKVTLPVFVRLRQKGYKRKDLVT